jgi:Cu(I)/Ag(I) efflux system periplasmic protein CusF
MNALTKLAFATAILVSAPFSIYAAPPAQPVASAEAASQMSEGEVRKVDKDAKKITIKHGELKNLAMPPMTMVFQAKDPALLEKVKPGDKVRFVAEKLGGQLTVMQIGVMQ